MASRTRQRCRRAGTKRAPRVCGRYSVRVAQMRTWAALFLPCTHGRSCSAGLFRRYHRRLLSAETAASLAPGARRLWLRDHACAYMADAIGREPRLYVRVFAQLPATISPKIPDAIPLSHRLCHMVVWTPPTRTFACRPFSAHQALTGCIAGDGGHLPPPHGRMFVIVNYGAYGDCPSGAPSGVLQEWAWRLAWVRGQRCFGQRADSAFQSSGSKTGPEEWFGRRKALLATPCFTSN
jgi:hypothetical protein